jgi:L-iditol 2-dehydrogenase
MSLDLGALLEPLSVAIQAAKRAQLQAGATVLAKISGAGTVVIADIDQGRVDFAVKNNFADRSFTVPMKRGNTIEEQLEIAKETAAAIGKTPRGSAGEVGEVDAVFECTGVPSCVQASIYVSSVHQQIAQPLTVDRPHDQEARCC